MKIPMIALATSMVMAPAVFTASFAAGGSDIPPSTIRAAVAGATTNGAMGTSVGNSVSPTNGTRGGGMATGGGMKAGGQERKSKVKQSSP